MRFVILLLLLVIGSSARGQPYLSSDHPRPMARRTMEIGRTFDAATSGTRNPIPRVSKPSIITRKDWEAGESSGTMRSHFPVTITFHHEGSPKALTADKDPKLLLRNLQKFGWKERNWPDLPYHFLIDLEGNIYEGRDQMKVGDTNTAYNPAGKLLISVLGNYEIQAPNEKQLTKISDLMAWLSDLYNIPPETIRGHLEYTTTACPGLYLYPYVASGFFEGEVRKRLAQAYGVLRRDESQSTGSVETAVTTTGSR